MNCCIICYKSCESNSSEFSSEKNKRKVKSVIANFFKLLRRHLSGDKCENNQSTKFPFELEKVMEAGLLSCHDCYMLMVEFCDIYHIWKETELVLNWKANTIGEIMKNANQVPARMSNYFNCLKTKECLGIEEEELKNRMDKWKSSISNQCKERAQKGYPKLILKHCKALNVQTSKLSNSQEIGQSFHEDQHDAMNISQLSSLLVEENSLNNTSDEEGSEAANLDLKAEPGKKDVINFSQTYSPVSCRICKDTFLSKIHFTHHYKSHQNLALLEFGTDSSTRKKNGCTFNTEKEQLLRHLVERFRIIGKQVDDMIENYVSEDEERRSISRLRSIHRCQKCSKTFSTKMSLKTHQKLHSSTCQEPETSDDASSNEESVTDDSSSESSDDDYLNQNSDDSDEFPRLPSLHKVTTNRPSTFPASCGVCKKTFTDQKEFEWHYHTHHKPLKSNTGFYTCKESGCTAYFTKLPQLHQHLQDAHLRFSMKPKLSACMSNVGVKTEEGGAQLTTNRNNFQPQTSKSCVVPRKSSRIVSWSPVSCRICKKRFGDISVFKSHYKLQHRSSKVESKKPLYSCKVPGCNARFRKYSKLRSHRGRHRDKDGSDQHLNTDHDFIQILNIPCQAEGCSEILYCVEDFEDHKALHGTFFCCFCSSSFDYAPKLALHELSEHSEVKDECPREQCDFKGEDEDDLVFHYLTDHLKLSVNKYVRKFSCKICALGFRNKGQVIDHFNNWHCIDKGKSFVCCDKAGCSAYFRTVGRLNLHKIRIHKISEYKCKVCDKLLATSRGLQRHTKDHHTNKEDLIVPCIVEGCDATFKTEKSRDIHILFLHNKEKYKIIVKCPKCDKKLFGNHNLELHLATHVPKVKTRRFVCELCGKAFRDKEHLNQHYLSHSGPESWKYQCGVCNKKCFSKQKLDEHERTHGNEKLFVCDICGVKYAHRHNLRIHVNNKHSDLTKDEARKYDRTHLTSKKGLKRKRKCDEGKSSSEDSDSS